LQLLEEAVVELNIVERASDNTIGRIRGRYRVVGQALNQPW
jgi:hypothetical protein